MRRSHLRGRLSDLESLKSGKDRTRPWVLFVCLHSNESPTKSTILRGPLKTKRDGFSPRTEPPPCHLSTTDLALSGQLIFATRNSKIATLHRPNCVCYCENSDLTSLRQRRSSLKEVIQPHLPVRLPCYDFTPLTGHSFGASVPHGFGQRLREHQIQVM
jgi:hypothetical protein